MPNDMIRSAPILISVPLPLVPYALFPIAWGNYVFRIIYSDMEAEIQLLLERFPNFSISSLICSWLVEVDARKGIRNLLLYPWQDSCLMVVELTLVKCHRRFVVYPGQISNLSLARAMNESWHLKKRWWIWWILYCQILGTMMLSQRRWGRGREREKKKREREIEREWGWGMQNFMKVLRSR